jgi:thiol-disulfide isomerase/thioredoxin
MNFFHQFFDHYISGTNNRFVKRDDLYATINSQYSYPAMLDSLGKDSLLRNEVIRELVLVKTLMELFNNPDFSKANIIDMLKQVSEKSKFERHRGMAASAIHQLTRFEQGFPAPYFNLPALDGDSLSLPEFEGKPLYLSFMTTWSYACLGEFELLNKLYAEYGNSIHFVTISLDKDSEVVSRFKDDKQYDWEFLYNGSNYDLILDFDIKTFPMFVLIDRNGKMFQYAAYKPSELIKENFKQVLKK